MLQFCLSNRTEAEVVTEGNSRTTLPSWLCIYWSKSRARTWQNEPWYAAATHGIPPFSDHCYLEIPKVAIKFDKNHNKTFVRIIEIFLFKTIWLCIARKLDHALKKNQPWKERHVKTKKSKGLYLIDWFSEINRLISQVINIFYT